MDKEIYEHRDYVMSEIKRIDLIKNNQDKSDAFRFLLTYHDMQVKNFQHERHIHLLVTITFGFIAIGFLAVLFIWLWVDNNQLDIVTILLTMVSLTLIILEGFYVRFYYHLENKTQHLYKLGADIYQKIQSMLK